MKERQNALEEYQDARNQLSGIFSSTPKPNSLDEAELVAEFLFTEGKSSSEVYFILEVGNSAFNRLRTLCDREDLTKADDLVTRAQKNVQNLPSLEPSEA
jgi:hypothetical protein